MARDDLYRWRSEHARRGPVDPAGVERELEGVKEALRELAKAKKDGNGGGRKSWDTFMRIAVPILIAVVVGAATMLIRHNNHISVIQRDVEALETAVDRLPPQWLQNAIDRLDRRVENLENGR